MEPTYNLRENPRPTPKNNKPTHRQLMINPEPNQMQESQPNRDETTPDLPNTESESELSSINNELVDQPIPTQIELGLHNNPCTATSNIDPNTQLMFMIQKMNENMISMNKEVKQLVDTHKNDMAYIIQQNNNLEQKIIYSCESLKIDITNTLKAEIHNVRQEMNTHKLDTENKFGLIDKKLKETVTQKQLGDIVTSVAVENQLYTKDYTNRKLEEVTEKLTTVVQDTKNVISDKYKKVDNTLTQHEVLLNNHDLCIKASDTQINKLQQDFSKLSNDLQQSNTAVHTNLIGLPEILLQCTNSNISDNLPKFDGKSRNPKEFIKKLNEYHTNLQKKRGIKNDISYLDLVELSLQGNALTWWEVVKPNIQNATEFEERFLNQYWSIDLQRGLRRRIENDKYKLEGRMSRTEFFLDRVMLLRNVTPPLDEYDIVQILSESFDEKIIDAMRVQNITTVQHFIDMLNRQDISEQNRSLRARNNTNIRSEAKTETTHNPRPNDIANYNPRNNSQYTREYKPNYNPNTQYRSQEYNPNRPRTNVYNSNSQNINKPFETSHRTGGRFDNQNCNYTQNRRTNFADHNHLIGHRSQPQHELHQSSRPINSLQLNTGLPQYHQRCSYPSQEQRRLITATGMREQHLPRPKTPPVGQQDRTHINYPQYETYTVQSDNNGS